MGEELPVEFEIEGRLVDGLGALYKSWGFVPNDMLRLKSTKLVTYRFFSDLAVHLSRLIGEKTREAGYCLGDSLTLKLESPAEMEIKGELVGSSEPFCFIPYEVLPSGASGLSPDYLRDAGTYLSISIGVGMAYAGYRLGDDFTIKFGIKKKSVLGAESV
jgi:hypothetical protein